MFNNDIVNMFLRLAPFLLVCFFSLYSVFNRDARGVIYLAGLLFACFFTVLIGNFPVFQKFHKNANSKLNNFPYHAYNLSCRMLEVNDSGPISHLPLGQTILAYTLMFIGYPIFKYNFANKDFILNDVIVVVTFIALIVADFIGNLSNGCFKLSAMITSFILGSSVGVLWGHMIDATNDNLQMFFTPDYNKRSKSRSQQKDKKGMTQRCKPVQSRKIYQINETSDDISSFCVDGGVIIICDRGNNVVQRVTYDQTYTNVLSSSIIAGKIASEIKITDKDSIDTSKITDDQLNNPHTVCRDSAGNIYISDTERHVIRKVNKSDGKVDIFAGKLDRSGNGGNAGKATNAILNRPTAMCMDNKNNLWVICENSDDKKTKCIRVISDQLIINTVYSDVGSSSRDFSDNTTICADKTNTVYIYNNNTVYYIKPQPYQNTAHENVSLNTLQIIKTDGFFSGSDGVLYNSNSGNTVIQPTTIDYQTYTATLKTNKITQDTSTNNIKKVDAIGNYVFLLSGSQIQKADISAWATNPPTNPIPTSIYGKTSIITTFNGPRGMCLSNDGNTIYVADTGNNIIRSIDSESDRIDKYAGVIGESGSDNDHLDRPTDVCIGKDGTIYILDSGNNRIMKIFDQGKMEKIADVFWSSDDKVGNIDYEIEPIRFCIDSLSNFYVVFDRKSNITKITKDGVPVYNYMNISNGNPRLDICTDSSNNLYITDNVDANSKIHKLNWNGTIHVTYNEDNDIQPFGTLSYIQGIFVDVYNDIYTTNKDGKVQYINMNYKTSSKIKKEKEDIYKSKEESQIVIPKAFRIMDESTHFTRNMKQQNAKSVILNNCASICKNKKYIFITDTTGNFICKIYTNKAGI